MTDSRPVRTVSGEPTYERLRLFDTWVFSVGDQCASMSSTGGGSWPRVPRMMFVNACCADVNSSSAIATSSAAMTFTATIT
jgi:hypothetical protein